MWPEPDRLHQAPNCASVYQFTGFNGAAGFEMFAVANAINALGFGLHTAHLIELGEGGHAGFIAHIVFAMPHYFDAERGAVGGDAGAEHELNVGVFEDGAFVGYPFDFGEFGGKFCGEIWLWGIPSDEFCACIEQTGDLTINMAVVDANDGEINHRGRLWVVKLKRYWDMFVFSAAVRKSRSASLIF